MPNPLAYLVAGARPNFMKIAPIVRAIEAHGGLDYKIIHTGQHYDREMNEVFFEELGIPEPDVFMAAGGGSHAQQTAKIMVTFEELCQAQRPDAVLVVGDVNSTLACSIVAKDSSIDRLSILQPIISIRVFIAQAPWPEFRRSVRLLCRPTTGGGGPVFRHHVLPCVPPR